MLSLLYPKLATRLTSKRILNNPQLGSVSGWTGFCWSLAISYATEAKWGASMLAVASRGVIIVARSARTWTSFSLAIFTSVAMALWVNKPPARFEALVRELQFPALIACLYLLARAVPGVDMKSVCLFQRISPRLKIKARSRLNLALIRGVDCWWFSSFGLISMSTGWTERLSLWASSDSSRAEYQKRTN